VEYVLRDGVVRSLDEADLIVQPGEVVGVVGESGSGKSTLASAIGQLLPTTARYVGGDVLIDGRSVLAAGSSELRTLRRQVLGFIPQSPIATLDPTMRVGRQLALGTGCRRDSQGAVLRKVGLTDPGSVLPAYPHQLSGGMAQRVAIALATARQPRLLIADEPTASLDRTVQATIMDLLVEMSRAEGTALIIFTHDLRIVARYCDSVGVMYGGRIVETGPTEATFEAPLHPYMQGLLGAAPGSEDPGGTVLPIPGGPPTLRGPSVGCAFAARCSLATEVCSEERPQLRMFSGHLAACHRLEDVDADRIG
jgi:oligopeptide/dipeptide ABC transporter ATP-binding protein